jgi:hypothetical protein
MIDCKVIKSFAGLEEGRITQLSEQDFAKLQASGHCEALPSLQNKSTAKDISNDTKKVNKK